MGGTAVPKTPIDENCHSLERCVGAPRSGTRAPKGQAPSPGGDLLRALESARCTPGTAWQAELPPAVCGRGAFRPTPAWANRFEALFVLFDHGSPSSGYQGPGRRRSQLCPTLYPQEPRRHSRRTSAGGGKHPRRPRHQEVSSRCKLNVFVSRQYNLTSKVRKRPWSKDGVAAMPINPIYAISIQPDLVIKHESLVAREQWVKAKRRAVAASIAGGARRRLSREPRGRRSRLR
jgi:hypothetical protein